MLYYLLFIRMLCIYNSEMNIKKKDSLFLVFIPTAEYKSFYETVVVA
jgi:hypothetical protein